MGRRAGAGTGGFRGNDGATGAGAQWRWPQTSKTARRGGDPGAGAAPHQRRRRALANRLAEPAGGRD
eukprot:6259388-Lingulodinium_polyedra.AAC.1